MAWHRYIEAVESLLRELKNSQGEVMLSAAKMIADCLRGEHAFHIFGNGHSSVLMQEVYHRAGGLALVNPVVDPLYFSIFFPHKERPGQTLRWYGLEGYGTFLLNLHDVRPGDVVMVASVSGTNTLPIELAQKSKQIGAKVIAITSLNFSKALQSRHSAGLRLFEVADLVLDNLGEIGDVSLEIQGLAAKVGPTSNVVGMVLLWAVLVEAMELLAKSGMEVPVLKSVNLEGAADYNAAQMLKYGDRIRYLI